MTQPTYMQVDGEDTGQVFVTKLNEIISAHTTDFAGSVAPANPVAYMFWLDTSTNPATHRRRNATNTNWEIDTTGTGVGAVETFNGRTGDVTLTTTDVFTTLPPKTGNEGKVLGLQSSGTVLEWKYSILTPVIEHREFGTNALITPPFNDYELNWSWWDYRPSCDSMVLQYVSGTPQILYTKYYVYREYV